MAMQNGSDGMPLAGRSEEYATEMWLDDPSAFWLHPEGPLSETTPDEWRAKQAERERKRREAMAQNPYANAYAQMAASQLNGLAAYQQSSLMQATNYQGSMNSGGLSALLGGALGSLLR